MNKVKCPLCSREFPTYKSKDVSGTILLSPVLEMHLRKDHDIPSGQEFYDLMESVLGSYLCPKCGKGFSGLYERFKANAEYWVHLGDGDELMEEDPEIEPVSEISYVCPQCKSVLFKSKEEAYKFLKEKRRWK